MSIEKEIKKTLIQQYARTAHDTGSPEVQVSILTTRIKNLSEHMKANKKDKHSQRGLLMMVNRRRRLLAYLKGVSVDRYKTLIQSLGLRH